MQEITIDFNVPVVPPLPTRTTNVMDSVAWKQYMAAFQKKLSAENPWDKIIPAPIKWDQCIVHMFDQPSTVMNKLADAGLFDGWRPSPQVAQHIDSCHQVLDPMLTAFFKEQKVTCWTQFKDHANCQVVYRWTYDERAKSG